MAERFVIGVPGGKHFTVKHGEHSPCRNPSRELRVSQSLVYLNAVVCQEREWKVVFITGRFELTKAAHKDAIWGASWTPDDRVISVSADGTIKQWDSSSGQITRAGPRHPLGLTSISTSHDGRYAVFNSIEGLTQMWDLQTGDIVGKFESYARPTSAQIEPCMLLPIRGLYCC